MMKIELKNSEIVQMETAIKEYKNPAIELDFALALGELRVSLEPHIKKLKNAMEAIEDYSDDEKKYIDEINKLNNALKSKNQVLAHEASQAMDKTDQKVKDSFKKKREKALELEEKESSVELCSIPKSVMPKNIDNNLVKHIFKLIDKNA